jgi:hypothetical protein
MKNSQASPTTKHWGRWTPALLAVILALLFWRSFLPDYVHFSNDSPLGQQNVNFTKLPAAATGMWDDLNETGFTGGAFSPGFSSLVVWILGPVGYAKFFPAVCLFILGVGAWVFYRALKLTPLAAALGALSVMLCSTFFAGACWGVASLEIAMGFNFLALALVMANRNETPRLVRWMRLVLAGICVGLNVIDSADIGALSSLLIAGFVFYQSLVETNGNKITKTLRGIGHVAVVAVFATFLAFQAIFSLVGTAITGIAGMDQNAETKGEHWDWATQWSLPKKETLGVFVPGLFGYRMDTPNKMMPSLQNAYQGGVYWGGMGRTPEIDRYFDSGALGTPPGGMMRFGYAGNYCGILVVLVAFWGIAQSFRRQNSVFPDIQKKFIWFWTFGAVVTLLLAWGRFAPMFYGLLYQLPYFSTIRNPAKFFVLFGWALTVLFAYGIHALDQRHLVNETNGKGKAATKKWDNFDRKWTFVTAGVFGASVIGWLLFAGHKTEFVEYLKKVGYGDENFAQQIAEFCFGQTGWFIILFGIALALLTLVLTGYFSGRRATLGAVLLGAFLVFDLGRANLPFIIHWDYKQKYEVGSLNPVVEFLRDKPYEHRVAGLPFESQQPLRGYDIYFGGSGLYRIEWMQHHFPYYNIQCLDIIQMPRMPEDLKAYLGALQPRSEAEIALFARHWELSNTRYLLGAAGFLNVLNQQLDPGKNRFRIAQRFDIVPKPGVIHPTQLEEFTVVTNNDGDLALFDFTGALPRAKLYSNWQVNTNDQQNLKTLADLNFDPQKTVLISTPKKDLPAVATNENTGSVEFKSYTSKHLVFNANATAPSVLLLNDKYDPHWRVTVDGQPAELLRCNFFMRGVQVPPGQHTVEFQFSVPNKPLYVTFTAVVIGIVLSVLLFFIGRREAKT